jgi:hypothetical protein
LGWIVAFVVGDFLAPAVIAIATAAVADARVFPDINMNFVTCRVAYTRAFSDLDGTTTIVKTCIVASFITEACSVFDISDVNSNARPIAMACSVPDAHTTNHIIFACKWT